MTTITIHAAASADIERLKLQLSERLIDTARHVPITDLFPNMTPEEWKRMTTAEWVLVSEKPTRRYMATREMLEDSRVPIQTIFGFQCRCVALFDEPEFGTPEYDAWEAEENQKAMDAFWAERPTT